MRTRSLLSLIAVFTSATALAQSGPQSGAPLTLHYQRPAKQWIEALPIGNGRMGAMIFGGPDREQLQLNEDTLYSGEPPADLRSIDIKKTLPQVIQLIRDNKHAEADAFVMKNWLGRNQQCYQPLGDLFLEFAGSGEVKDYRRWLDIGTATAGVSYKRGGVTFTREIFASASRPGDRRPPARRPARCAGLHRPVWFGASHRQVHGGEEPSDADAANCPASSPAGP